MPTNESTRTNESDQWSSESTADPGDAHCVILPREGHESVLEIGGWRVLLTCARTPKGWCVLLRGRVKVTDQVAEKDYPKISE